MKKNEKQKNSVELVNRIIETSKKQELEARMEFESRMGPAQLDFTQRIAGEYKSFGIWVFGLLGRIFIAGSLLKFLWNWRERLFFNRIYFFTKMFCQHRKRRFDFRTGCDVKGRRTAPRTVPLIGGERGWHFGAGKRASLDVCRDV